MTPKEILTADREYVIRQLNRFFPSQSISVSMAGLLEYCNVYGLENEDQIFDFISNFRKQETTFDNLGKSTDTFDLIKDIRAKNRNFIHSLNN